MAEDDLKKQSKPSKFWLNLNESQRDIRVLFFEKQKDVRAAANDPLKKAVKNLTTGIKGPAASKWKADLVFNFHVMVAGIGIILGDFRRVSGLGTDEWDFETYREGGDNGPEHILLNHTKSGRVILEWAIRHPDPFLIWWITTGTGVIVSEPITVTLLEGQTPRAIWIIPQAMIVKIEAPELDALRSEVAINRVELIHNGLIPVPM